MNNFVEIEHLLNDTQFPYQIQYISTITKLNFVSYNLTPSNNTWTNIFINYFFKN